MGPVQAVHEVRQAAVGRLAEPWAPKGLGAPASLSLAEVTDYLRPFQQLHPKLLDPLRAPAQDLYASPVKCEHFRLHKIIDFSC